MIESLLGLGAAGILHGALDSTAWRAYESVEEAWIRDRYELLVKYTPAAAGAAEIDLDLKLAELHRRSMQFKYMLKHNPKQLRGGVWQLSWLPITEAEKTDLEMADATYRRHERRIRELSKALREHADYGTFRQAQTRLWKTPDYREIHRKYSGRMHELQKLYARTGIDPS
jgi:hypothetical protein